MLSQSKQTIYSFQRPSVSQSTSRQSGSSTSACKKMLKSICEDSQFTQRNFQSIHLQGDSTIREIKLKQTINILQKKNNKQTQEIIMLTQDLNTLAKVRQDQLKNLEIQMEKIKKSQLEKNQSNRCIAELKKKITQLETSNTALKNADVEKKMIKLKQILRKKEVSLSEVSAKLCENDNIQQIMMKQREEISSLRENFLKLKQKQSNIEQQNHLYKAKLSQCKQQTVQLKSQLFVLQQQNKRLQTQSEQLQLYYDQSQKQSSNIESEMVKTIECQNKQIQRLRQIVQKIQNIEAECEDNRFCDVYKEEIGQLVRANVVDKAARARLEKGLAEVIDNMEESMNRILMQIVATHL